MTESLYRILELDSGATPKAIKSAFRRLARAYHPDRNPDNPEAERRFKDVVEAYEVLRSPQRRARYDRWRTSPSREPEPSTSMHSETAREFVQAFSEASTRAQTVFFDALLPRYMEAYGTGPGYLLVYHLVNDLDHVRFMDIMERPTPSFGTKPRVNQLLQNCRVHIDSGAKLDPMGKLTLGQLTSVRSRGLEFHTVTLYAGSFFASGRRDVDGLSVTILKVLIREYTRFLELPLQERLRPIHQRTLDPNAPIPYSPNEAKWRDYGQSTARVFKWTLLIATSLVAIKLIWDQLVPG